MKINEKLANTLYWNSQSIRGKGEIQERLNWLNETQMLSPEKIKEIQLGKLINIVEHAYNTVPYYNKVFKERGLSPNDITNFEDLKKLPLLTREILLENQEDLISRDADFKTLKENFSSGSTGVRAQFKQDLNFRMWMRAHQLRTYQWCNDWDLGKPFVLLWGSEMYWSLKEVYDYVDNILSNRREFNTFNLSNKLVTDFLNKLDEFNPYLVSTYTNAMYLIAKEAERQGKQISGLKAIQVTSEPVPEAMRRDMKRIFNCEVYDKYGSRETNIVSHESPNHEGNLIQTENVFVEFLTDEGLDCEYEEQGNLVLTTLNNFSMPLIRYETSDLAAPLEGTCSSGINLPRMTSVHGRKQDLIMKPNGEFIDSYFFSYLLMRYKAIHWFQIVQQKIDTLLIRLYTPHGIPNNNLDEIKTLIYKHANFKFKIQYETLSEMPKSHNGKFRLCISDLGAYTWR